MQLAVGFCLAVAGLVFVALYAIFHAVSTDLKRSLGPYPPASPHLPSAAPTGTPRPLIITLLGWATVVHQMLWGLLVATMFIGGFADAPYSDPSAGPTIVLMCLFPLLMILGGLPRILPFMALSPAGCHRMAAVSTHPAGAIVLGALISAIRLVRVFRTIVADTGGWNSPELLQAYVWVALWMTLTAMIVILSTLITYGLQTEEVRRVFMETRSAPQPSPSL